MGNRINIGDYIPEFMAVDQEGFEITDEDLLGANVVLYFYPKDDTPSCTKQACGFRDTMEEIEDMDAVVIGVSADDETSHQKFTEKYGLNFTLLSDPKMEMARAFDVVREKDGRSVIERTTFVIDSEGEIRWMERPVNVDGHSERVIEALEKIEEVFEDFEGEDEEDEE